MKTILLFWKITIPGNIEYLLYNAKFESNYRLYGTHLNIYYSRNLFFFFTFLSSFFYYINYHVISFYFITFGSVNHAYQFYKWNNLVIKKDV